MSDRDFNLWIRSVDFLGIPGDVIAHLVIGALIGWVAFLIVGKAKKAVWFIFILALGKEVLFDGYANLTQGMVFEPIKDILLSIVGAGVVLFILRRPFK